MAYDRVARAVLLGEGRHTGVAWVIWATGGGGLVLGIRPRRAE